MFVLVAISILPRKFLHFPLDEVVKLNQGIEMDTLQTVVDELVAVLAIHVLVDVTLPTQVVHSASQNHDREGHEVEVPVNVVRTSAIAHPNAPI
jgi:hypothetical protein